MRRIPASIYPLALAVLFFADCRKTESDLNSLSVTGLIEAVQTDIRAQVQGEVKEVLVQEGQPVRKGDLLCRLDDERIRIQLDEAKAGLAGAHSKLDLAKMGSKKEMIAMAKTQVEIAAKQLEIAAKDQERLARLLSQGAISETQKEKTDLALKAAQEQSKSAQENYDMAVRGHEKEEIDMVRAEIRDLEARSPIDALVQTRQVEKGELALPGAILFSLIDFGHTYVKAYVPERYLGRVLMGGAVGVVCDALPGKIFKGHVDFVSQEAEFAPKNIQTKEERLKLVYMVKSYLDNAAGDLKPGLPVDVTIALAPAER
ncbi:MAG: efflux RND transporter periplasmic adaptor subunit [Candidatus Aminicenantales bacterium]